MHITSFTTQALVVCHQLCENFPYETVSHQQQCSMRNFPSLSFSLFVIPFCLIKMPHKYNSSFPKQKWKMRSIKIWSSQENAHILIFLCVITFMLNYISNWGKKWQTWHVVLFSEIIQWPLSCSFYVPVVPQTQTLLHLKTNKQKRLKTVFTVHNTYLQDVKVNYNLGKSTPKLK